MRPLRQILIVSVAVAQGALGHAQQPGLAMVLQRLGEQAAALDRSLPSFSCLQTATSDELLAGKKGSAAKVLRHVTFTANLRVRRGADGQLAESAEFLTVDGHAFSGGGFTMPAYAQGGFRQALAYFLPEQQRCYRYTLLGDHIKFEGTSGAARMSGCRSAGTSGFATLDADGNLLHLERSVSAPGVAAYQLIPFAQLDLAPVMLNGVSYRLSSHLLSERPNGRFVDRFEASYSDCKLFTATVIIGPASDLPQD